MNEPIIAGILPVKINIHRRGGRGISNRLLFCFTGSQNKPKNKKAQRERDRERERENSNMKTLILKFSSVRSIWTDLIARERGGRGREREREPVFSRQGRERGGC